MAFTITMGLYTHPSNHSHHEASIGNEDNSLGPLARNELRLLSVLKADDAQNLLYRIAKPYPWSLEVARNSAQALQVLQSGSTQIVLFDIDLLGLDWKSNLRALVSSPSQPSVIVVSSGVSDALWEEIIECGGYDVLDLPLQEAKTQLTLQYAWRFWANCQFPARTPQTPRAVSLG